MHLKYSEYLAESPSIDAIHVRLLMGYLLAADHLVAVVLLGQHSEGGLDDATTQAQDQMQSGL